jgi:YesN/AraC family two-component response regulator
MSVDAGRILIVDDDRIVRDFAVNAIEFGTNRQVITFENGFHAWQFIVEQGSRVDMVLADAHLPEMTGLELLERIKRNFPDKVFILVSSSFGYQEPACQMGADAFIAKPFDIQDLFAVIERFVSPPSPRCTDPAA